MDIRILILEDNPEDAEIILRTIKHSGLNILHWRHVDNESAFREALAVDAPDLVIADYRLPSFDAFRALNIVVAEGREIAFIVVSNVIEEETAIRILREGADDYLLKDRLGRIGEAIRYAIERRRLRLSEQHAMVALQEALESERLLRQEAEKANRIKQEFLASVSHELVQPLNGILGWSDLILRGAVQGQDLERAIKVIQNCGMQQKKLVDDLLELARTATGKFSIKTQEVSLHNVLDLAMKNIDAAARAKQMKFTITSSIAQAYVAGDQLRLVQIFSNLLSNAVKFSSTQGRVDVVVHQVHSHIEVEIRDMGEGMAPDFIPHAFDRFRQEDQSTTRAHGGLGLGLPLARDLVELHGGTIRCSSPGKGQGSTFVVSLPCLAVRSIPDQVSKKAEVESLTGKRVLVVDDDPVATLLVEKILQVAGADVICADSAAAARMKLGEFLPHILVSDISMPQESGLDLIKSMRSAATRVPWTEIPAVALTALGDKLTRVQAVAAGFQELLVKPVDSKALVDTIGRLVAS